MPARVVQLSDLHLTKHLGARAWGSDSWANLRQVLNALERSAGRVDLLVITGDIASRGCLATYERLRDWLAPWQDRLCLVPGNHDSRAMVRSVFGHLMLPDQPRANFVREIAGWKLVGLDSQRRFRVHGQLGRDQLAWLASELGGSDAPVMLFLHHPPVRVGCWWVDKDLVRDRTELAARLRGRNVQAIAAGHVHQPFEGSFAGATVWTCPSTAYQFRPGSIIPGPSSREPAYRVFELDRDDVRTELVRL